MKRFLLLVLAGIALFAFILITSLMWYRLFYNDSAITPVSSIDIYLDDENRRVTIDTEKSQYEWDFNDDSEYYQYINHLNTILNIR